MTRTRGVWRARLGSNQQPLPSEGSTLSIELRTRSVGFYQRTSRRPGVQGRRTGRGPYNSAVCAGVREPHFGPVADTPYSALRIP